MPRKRHALSGATYESDGEGVVRVTNKAGVVGRFDGRGSWIDGELREADPHMCLWVAGRQLPPGAQFNAKDRAFRPRAPDPKPEPEESA
jgi:hypothetical protein